MIRGIHYKLSVVFFLLTFCIYSQKKDNTWEVEVISNIPKTEEDEEESFIFKFEPNYLAAIEDEKASQAKNRAILDTLSISERKKKRLRKKVFTKNFSQDLSRVADIKFEDGE